jgi:hypothetical protein
MAKRKPLTAATWWSCTDVKKMLAFLCAEHAPGDRKLRLYACCCARQLDLLREPVGDERDAARRLLGAIDAAEAVADGLKPEKTLGKHWPPYAVAGPSAADAARHSAADLQLRGKKPLLVSLARCVFGDPFHAATLDPAWRTPEAVGLARTAYAERSRPEGALDPARLGVLADALEEAGCCESALLEHLRDPGSHTRGCWAVDWALGKNDEV